MQLVVVIRHHIYGIRKASVENADVRKDSEAIGIDTAQTWMMLCDTISFSCYSAESDKNMSKQ